MNAPEFYPPRLNPLLVRVSQALAPWLIRQLYWVELDIGQTSLQRLSQVQQQRVILLPNHPTFHDPLVMFLLSARLQQPFYYLAAYETFRNTRTMFSITGRFALLRSLADAEFLQQIFRGFVQRMGMYSIRRGLADRASIAQTLNLLVQSACHLVIFPEGGCSFQNDTVMPFRAGGIQMAFQAMNRFAKQREPLPDLYAVPVTIKYIYVQDMELAIQNSLKRLEQVLELTAGDGTLYDRLRSVAGTVLARIEQDYGIAISETEAQSWNQRIDALKLQVIQKCEHQFGLQPAPGELMRERVYRVQDALRQRDDDPGEQTEPDLSQATVEKAISRLLNFDAIYDGYVATDPTPERFLDTLTRLEREVFNIDQPPPKGFRRAKVQVGEPLNLKDYFDSYRHDRYGTVQKLVSQLQQEVQTTLDCYPISV
ncbi:hypothetical protein BST81_00305 [Leptolyngbya sp. 'hensonii']|uniref:lysophospholipid acyltransferase family protein n=1 Tax=Leptolyngbya sp. 'hensonii' TaxID=1922337 RepID=UPI00094FE258|nr:1-acyl-sn-glycerol-3-phosphate acyltransferase [Leptolyngbya sp. 'hensonii']OLP20486.1 hypothetical protein BST81_00305 [Leptolyngbya sp. 'hensonii']